MAEPLATAAGIVGLVVPALHGVRKLLDDLRNIKDAPKTAATLETDLELLATTLDSLQTVDERQWKALGAKITGRSQVAISLCTNICGDLEGEVKRWTDQGRDGKMTWKARGKIGFFKEHQIQAMSVQLQSCKASLSSVVGTATLYSSLRSARTGEEIARQLKSTQTEISAVAATTGAEIARVQEMLGTLQVAVPPQEYEQVLVEEDEDDMEEAKAAKEQELAALQALQDLLKELGAKLEEKSFTQSVHQTRDESVTVTFGANNSGAQFGVNHAPIGSMTFGRP